MGPKIPGGAPDPRWCVKKEPSECRSFTSYCEDAEYKNLDCRGLELL